MPAYVEATALLRAMPAFAEDMALLRAMPAFAKAMAGDVERTGFEPVTPTLSK